jgi:hypothetical protein
VFPRCGGVFPLMPPLAASFALNVTISRAPVELPQGAAVS